MLFAILLCFALAVASFSFENYAAKLKEVSSSKNTFGISTLEYVAEINKTRFAGRLAIRRCAEWEDHYSSGVVALSDKTMSSNSLASLSIVSHELGHARQDASGGTLKKHWKMLRKGRMCGLFFMPLLLVGVVLSLLWVFQVLPHIAFLIAGAVCVASALAIFVFAIVLKYLEVKIEKEASMFALEFLQDFLTEKELKTCKDFLHSALLTYWGGLIRTLLSWTLLTKKDVMFR